MASTCQSSCVNGNLSDLVGVGTRFLEMSRCDLCIKKPHSESLARKHRRVSFTKKAHQECDLQLSWLYIHQDTTQNKCSNARQEPLPHETNPTFISETVKDANATRGCAMRQLHPSNLWRYSLHQHESVTPTFIRAANGASDVTLEHHHRSISHRPNRKVLFDDTTDRAPTNPRNGDHTKNEAMFGNLQDPRQQLPSGTLHP